MNEARRLVAVAVLGVAVLGALAVVLLTWPGGSPAADVPADRARVTVYENGTGSRLGSVVARVAATPAARFRGLSDTPGLAPDEGMLFVYPTTGSRTFVMRNMSFPLDIVFIDGAGTITAIHRAPTPPPNAAEEDLIRYRGRAKWVLEVTRNWTAEHGVSVGDRVGIEYGSKVTITAPTAG